MTKSEQGNRFVQLGYPYRLVRFTYPVGFILLFLFIHDDLLVKDAVGSVKIHNPILI